VETEIASKGLAEKAHHDSAIADFDEAIRLNPQDTAYYVSRGNAYLGKDQHDQAIADYNEAIRLNPKNAAHFAARGTVHMHNGQYDCAIADFNEAIRLWPQRAEYFWARPGVREERLVRPCHADYDEAIRLDPKFTLAIKSRAETIAKKPSSGPPPPGRQPKAFV
jgi:tetratricopeptide (TPR) repeat protein